MELSGGTGNGGTYAAVAFSRTASMDDADLYYCTGNALKSGALHQRYDTPSTDSVLPVTVC